MNRDNIIALVVLGILLCAGVSFKNDTRRHLTRLHAVVLRPPDAHRIGYELYDTTVHISRKNGGCTYIYYLACGNTLYRYYLDKASSVLDNYPHGITHIDVGRTRQCGDAPCYYLVMEME